jgi:hypothetical protein
MVAVLEDSIQKIRSFLVGILTEIAHDLLKSFCEPEAATFSNINVISRYGTTGGITFS